MNFASLLNNFAQTNPVAGDFGCTLNGESVACSQLPPITTTDNNNLSIYILIIILVIVLVLIATIIIIIKHKNKTSVNNNSFLVQNTSEEMTSGIKEAPVAENISPQQQGAPVVFAPGQKSNIPGEPTLPSLEKPESIKNLESNTSQPTTSPDNYDDIESIPPQYG